MEKGRLVLAGAGWWLLLQQPHKPEKEEKKGQSYEKTRQDRKKQHMWPSSAGWHVKNAAE